MERFTTQGRSTRARGATLLEASMLTVALVVGSAASFRALGHGAAGALATATSALGTDGRGEAARANSDTVTDRREARFQADAAGRAQKTVRP